MCLIFIVFADPAIIPRTVRRAAGWRAYASGSMLGVLGGVYTRGLAAKRRRLASAIVNNPGQIEQLCLERVAKSTALSKINYRANPRLLNAVDA